MALRELLRERSVTRAVERLGVTQPAASAALSRLRRHFDDELLIRDRGEYTLTALGASPLITPASRHSSAISQIQ